jgi:FkbH-like protein
MTAWTPLLDQARYEQDWVRYSALARKADKLLRTEGPPAGHVPARVALLGGATTDLLTRPLRLAMLGLGLAPELHVAPFNQIHQELLDPGSATSGFAPRIAIVLPSPSNLMSWPDEGADVRRAAAAAEDSVRSLLALFDGLHQRVGTEFVLSNFLPPERRPNGNLSARIPSDPTSFLRRVNLVLADVSPPWVHLVDLAGMAELRGLDRLVDARLWFEAKTPVSPAFVPELARTLAALVGAVLGRAKKVLVLDLDNTLWGGVIGDDGLGGIELGEGSAAGEAFKALQQYALDLKRRGVLLAVVSKNEEDAARLPFLEHPESVLKLDDFAAIKANWEPKSDNLRALAAELDLGLDSFVFLDDNPAEREEVASALPQVTVVQGSPDPVDMLAELDRQRWFEVVAITDEDRQRSEFYRARREVASLEAGARDLSGFLRSLDMHARIAPIGPVSLERVTQLVNKTNQFNLTTRRMTGAEVERIAGSNAWLHRTVRLADRFGDHGLIAVFMGRIDGDALLVENWLMSCRVLNRGVERFLLDRVVRAAAGRGVRRIDGRYIPSARNALVRDHYERLGFERTGEEADGTSTWSLDTGSYQPLEHFIDAGEDD